MVRKLFKYDMISYFRTLLPINGIVLGIALMTRLVWLFENNDSLAFNIVSTSSIIFYVLSIIVCLVMTFALCVIRFYRNLYTQEGYLSFTLPVTQHQHITAKLLAALTITIFSVACVFVSVMIATCGDMTVELFKSAGYLLKQFALLAKGHTVPLILEGLLLLLVSAASSYLWFYTCITLGQMAKKNRILAAFGVYFVGYFIEQALSTVFMIVNALTEFRLVQWLYDAMEQHPFPTIHCILWSGILMSVILGVVFYAVNRVVMKRKLNLE